MSSNARSERIKSGRLSVCPTGLRSLPVFPGAGVEDGSKLSGNTFLLSVDKAVLALSAASVLDHVPTRAHGKIIGVVLVGRGHLNTRRGQ